MKRRIRVKFPVLAIAAALGASALVAACSFGPDAYNGPGLEPAPPDAGNDATANGGGTGMDAGSAGAAGAATAAGAGG
jgi:hypothetical protein